MSGNLIALMLAAAWAVAGGWWTLAAPRPVGWFATMLGVVNVVMWAGWAVARAGEWPAFGVVLDLALAAWWAAIVFAGLTERADRRTT